MKKTIKINMDVREGWDLVDDFVKKTGDYSFSWEGTLIDNHILENFDIMHDKQKYKHVILLETYLNEWSSGYEAILTNDLEVLEYYKKIEEREADIEDIINDFDYNNILSHIEEVGKIKADAVDYDLENLVAALERYYGKDFKLYNNTNGQYIALK